MKNLFLQLLLSAIFSATFAQGVGVREQKKFDTFYEKVKECLQSDLDSAYVIALQSVVLASSRKEKYKAYYILGYICNQRKRYIKSIGYYKKALGFADNNQVYSLKNNLADNYCEAGSLDSSLSLTREVRLYREKHHHKKLYLSYGTIGKIFSQKGEIDSAVFYFDKAIRLALRHQQGKITSHVSGLLVAKAKAYKDVGLVEQAIEAYKQSLNYEVFYS
mgnify:FL=1